MMRIKRQRRPMLLDMSITETNRNDITLKFSGMLMSSVNSWTNVVEKSLKFCRDFNRVSRGGEECGFNFELRYVTEEVHAFFWTAIRGLLINVLAGDRGKHHSVWIHVEGHEYKRKLFQPSKKEMNSCQRKLIPIQHRMQVTPTASIHRAQVACKVGFCTSIIALHASVSCSVLTNGGSITAPGRYAVCVFPLALLCPFPFSSRCNRTDPIDCTGLGRRCFINCT